MEAEQLKSIACTPFGYIVKDPVPEHPEFEEITAFKPSSTPLSKVWKGINEDRSFLRSDMSLTDEEIADPGYLEERYLIVGYTFPHFPATNMKKIAPDQRQARPTGILDHGNYLVDWTQQGLPLYVVTRILTSKQNYTVQLYALMKDEQTASLSTPFSIGQEAVFYRHEFRDLSTSYTQRKSNWNKSVTQHAAQTDDVVPINEARIRRYQSGQHGNLMVQGGEPLASELSMLVGNYHETKDFGYIDQMRKALHRTFPDLDRQPAPRYGGLLSFFTRKNPEFSITDAETVVEDMEAVAPNVADVTPTRVMELKKHLGVCKEKFEYHHLVPIIAGGVAKLEGLESSKDNPPFDTAELIKVTANILNTVPTSIIDKPYFAPNEPQHSLLTSAVLKLRELVDHLERSRSEVRDSLGNTGLVGIRYEDMRRNLQAAVDTPGMHFILSQSVRNVVAKYENVLKAEVIGPIKAIVKRLEKSSMASKEDAASEDDDSAVESNPNKRTKL